METKFLPLFFLWKIIWIFSTAIEFQDNETIRKKRFEGMGEIRILDASKFPDTMDIEKFLEPMVKVSDFLLLGCYDSVVVVW